MTEPTDAATPRIISLDVVRGAVMVLMAIDHVRVYSGVPAGGPTLGIFFTRWITHFCAPAFVFFAGTSAYLLGRKLKDTGALSRHLAMRGLMLVVLELTLIRACWTFNVDYTKFALAGVIWMLGWCMVLLAGLVWLRTSVVATIGLALVFAQNVFGFLPHAATEGAAAPTLGWLWKFLYLGGSVPLTANVSLQVLYVIVPWIGVMAAGYGFGALMTLERVARRRSCLRIGLTATAFFLVLGTVSLVMRPAGEHAAPWFIRLLNQQKYPASQLFLLMTLGPTIALLPLADRATGWFGTTLATFGRVPLFYYLLHIPLIHVAALVTWYLRDGSVNTTWFDTAPFVSVPPSAQWGLPLLYLVFALVVAALYFPCRWFAGVRARHRESLLRFL